MKLYFTGFPENLETLKTSSRDNLKKIPNEEILKVEPSLHLFAIIVDSQSIIHVYQRREGRGSQSQ
jgi:hypothetical protein